MFGEAGSVASCTADAALGVHVVYRGRHGADPDLTFTTGSSTGSQAGGRRERRAVVATPVTLLRLAVAR